MLQWKTKIQRKAIFAQVHNTVGLVDYLPVHSMVEIGVARGNGALAFLQANPDMHYLGIDVDECLAAQSKLQQFPHAKLLIADSRTLDELPGGLVDLVRVDGGKSATYSDMQLGWKHLRIGGLLLVHDYINKRVKYVRAQCNRWLTENHQTCAYYDIESEGTRLHIVVCKSK